jgi:hypothetical protein
MGSSDWTAGAAACSASVPAPEEAAAGAAAVGADSLPPKLQLDKALPAMKPLAPTAIVFSMSRREIFFSDIEFPPCLNNKTEFSEQIILYFGYIYLLSAKFTIGHS